MIHKTSVYFLLLLYCSALSYFHASNSFHNQGAQINEIIEECKSSANTFYFDHTNQFDLQIKSCKEQADPTFPKRISKLYNHNFSVVSVFKRQFVSDERSKRAVPLCFAQTDIIFPFHLFW